MKHTVLSVLAEDLDAHLRANELFADVYAAHDYIAAEIHWGDWKHDHFWCKQLTAEFFRGNGMDVDIQTEVTEEDGSDCYSAVHRIYLR